MSQRIATCPSCGAQYRIPDTFTKPRAACKKCGTAVDVPPLEAAAPAAPPPRPATRPEPAPAARPQRPRETAPPEPDDEEARPSRSRREAGPRHGGGRPARGKAAAHGSRSRGGAKGRSRRGGEDGEAEAGGSKTTMILVAVAVVVVVAVVAFFLLQGKKETPAQPGQTPVAEAPKAPAVDPAEEARKQAQELEERRRREEAEAEAARKAEAAKNPPKPAEQTPAATDPNAPKPKPKPLDKVDLKALPQLEFSPETSTKLQEEIKAQIENISYLWAPARKMGAGQKRLKEIGYHAVPAVINLALTLDYATKEGVQHGSILFMLLKDMCAGQGVEFKSTFNQAYEAEAWENEYDINWNENAVNTWHGYWTKYGSSKELWEQKIAHKKKEGTEEGGGND